MNRKKAALALQANNITHNPTTPDLPSPSHGEHTHANHLRPIQPNTAGSMGCSSDRSLLLTLQQLRVEVTKWAKNWGPEGSWDALAEEWVTDIQKRYRQSEVNELLDDLFTDWNNHAREGRVLLRRLQAATEDIDPTTLNSLTELQALFLQGYGMVVEVLSEVKFFEIKLDEYAPLRNRPMACSKVRYYGH